MPSLSKIGDLSCITSCLVLPGFLMDTLLIKNINLDPRKENRLIKIGLKIQLNAKENYWILYHKEIKKPRV